jgi:MFS family permease
MSGPNQLSVSSVTNGSHASFLPAPAKVHWRRWRAVYLYGLFTFISNFGDNIKIGPEIRLYELLVCRRYYLWYDPSYIDNHGFVDEKYCKLENVQGELSMLQAWLLFWIYLAGLPMTIPLGALADSIGRKAVIGMSLVAVTLTKSWVIIVCMISRSHTQRPIFTAVREITCIRSVLAYFPTRSCLFVCNISIAGWLPNTPDNGCRSYYRRCLGKQKVYSLLLMKPNNEARD